MRQIVPTRWGGVTTLVSLPAVVRHDRFVTAGTGGIGERAPLVGQRLELNWLRTRLDQTRRGFPHLVLVDGRPASARAALRKSSWPTLVGRA